MKLLDDYFSSLKCIYVEELVDLFLHRPLSFVLVKLFYPLPITPNQISFMALLVGIGGGISFALGTPGGFFWGAVLYGLSSVIDCADGMIARLKKNGTLNGRLVDGLVDYLVTISVFFSLIIGLSKATASGWLHLPLNPLLLVSLSGASFIAHAAITDKYRNRYEAHALGKLIIPQLEIEKFSRERERLRGQKWHFFEKALIASYLRYSALQVGKRTRPIARHHPGDFQRYNKYPVMLWNLAGSSTHITMVVVAMLLKRPMIFFFYCIVLANLWIAFMFGLQAVVDRKLRNREQAISVKL